MSGYVPRRVASTRTAIGSTDQTPEGYGSVMLGMLSSVGRSSSNWRAIKRRSYVVSNQQINKNKYNLHNVSKVNIISSNGNKYVFNNGNSYDSNLKYNLSVGGYKLKDVPMQHPIAILNSSKKSQITYKATSNVNTPIIIKVSGGDTNETNGDYYTFKDVNGNAIQIGNGTFRFMRGKTYKFEADNISSAHPFKLYMSEGFVNDNNGNNGGISGSGDSFTITIPSNHSVNAGDIYYQCSVMVV